MAPKQEDQLDNLAERITSMTDSIEETQSALLHAVKALTQDKPEKISDVLIKYISAFVPLLLALAAFYVSARLSPVEMKVQQIDETVRELRSQNSTTQQRLSEYAVNEGKRDMLLQQMQKDISETKAMLQKMADSHNGSK